MHAYSMYPPLLFVRHSLSMADWRETSPGLCTQDDPTRAALCNMRSTFSIMVYRVLNLYLFTHLRGGCRSIAVGRAVGAVPSCIGCGGAGARLQAGASQLLSAEGWSPPLHSERVLQYTGMISASHITYEP